MKSESVIKRWPAHTKVASFVVKIFVVQCSTTKIPAIQ